MEKPSISTPDTISQLAVNLAKQVPAHLKGVVVGYVGIACITDSNGREGPFVVALRFAVGTETGVATGQTVEYRGPQWPR